MRILHLIYIPPAERVGAEMLVVCWRDEDITVQQQQQQQKAHRRARAVCVRYFYEPLVKLTRGAAVANRVYI